MPVMIFYLIKKMQPRYRTSWPWLSSILYLPAPKRDRSTIILTQKPKESSLSSFLRIRDTGCSLVCHLSIPAAVKVSGVDRKWYSMQWSSSEEVIHNTSSKVSSYSCEPEKADCFPRNNHLSHRWLASLCICMLFAPYNLVSRTIPSLEIAQPTNIIWSLSGNNCPSLDCRLPAVMALRTPCPASSALDWKTNLLITISNTKAWGESLTDCWNYYQNLVLQQTHWDVYPFQGIPQLLTRLP